MDHPRRVAVIAVHGVGVHPPGQTQDDMSDLLLSLPARDYTAPRAYEAFRSVSIQIPLSPLKSCPFDSRGLSESSKPVSPPGLGTRIKNLYQEQSADFAYERRIRASAAAQSATTDTKSPADGATSLPPIDSVGDAGRRYTQMLLEDYEGGSEVAGNKYCTARLEGRRIADGAHVHIYEVLWADLAKPNNTILKFFLGLFQVLLHLASLSRTAVDTGSAEGTGRIFVLYRRFQRYAIRLLQIFAPLLQLLVLVACGSSLSTASGYTQDRRALPLAFGAIAGVLVGLIGIVRHKNKISISPWLWSLLAVLPGLIGIGIFWGFMLLLRYSHHDFTEADCANITAALAFWLLPGVGLFTWILSYYEDVRKGVRATGIVLFLTAFICFIVELHSAPAHLPSGSGVPLGRMIVSLASFWTSKLLLGYLRFCWFLIITFAFAALVLGSIAWRSIKNNPARRARARAAVRTSRLAFALPCLSFCLITLAIWASLIHLSSRISSNPIFPSSVITAPFPPVISSVASQVHMTWVHDTWHTISQATYSQGDDFDTDKDKKTTVTPTGFISDALAWSVGYQLPVSLVLVALAGFLLTWWALPSALTERFPYRNDAKNRQHSGKAPRDTDNATSLHMGTWLSRGIDSTSVITFLLWSAIFLAPAAWVILRDFAPDHSALLRVLSGLQSWTVIIVYSQILAAAVLLVYAARSGGVVLGIVLDVDTYLRDTPREAPPRARIFERYMSTLRYVGEFRDTDGHGYDEIVIVAHSLGALISGDILHFLQSPYSLEEKIPVPIKLLTMGNPARQLLNRFFPYLYDWIKTEPDNGAHPLPPPKLTAPASIPDAQLPRPHDLGLKQWVSAYRSGDYVGRSLWLEEWYLRTPNDADPRTDPPFLAQSADGTRAEMCIGAGAHTHYMDDTAPDIARMLDRLIS
jgi:hypothetical protein